MYSELIVKRENQKQPKPENLTHLVYLYNNFLCINVRPRRPEGISLEKINLSVAFPVFNLRPKQLEGVSLKN